MTSQLKSCFNCKWLNKYTAENRLWINVCEAEQPEEDEEGVFFVATINTDLFNPAACVLFKQKEKP